MISLAKAGSALLKMQGRQLELGLSQNQSPSFPSTNNGCRDLVQECSMSMMNEVKNEVYVPPHSPVAVDDREKISRRNVSHGKAQMNNP